jgi:hypothetical protein
MNYKTCPYCKTPQYPDARFCSSCANSLDNSAHTFLTSKRSIIIITALGTTVAFLLGVFLLSVSNSTSQKKFNEQVSNRIAETPGATKMPTVTPKTQAPVSFSSTPAIQTPKTTPRTPDPTPEKESVPAGASARCRDGTLSYSQNRRGTCSHHGGVAEWF